MSNVKLDAKDKSLRQCETNNGQLNLVPLESKLRLNRLRWYGQVERSDKWINKYTHLEKDGFKDRGRPLKTWSP